MKIKYLESSLELKMVNSYSVPIIHIDHDNKWHRYQDNTNTAAGYKQLVSMFFSMTTLEHARLSNILLLHLQNSCTYMTGSLSSCEIQSVLH